MLDLGHPSYFNEIMPLGTQTFRRTVCAVAVVFACCGCSHLATVKETRARLPAATEGDEQLQAAKQCLVSAEREQPLRSLGENLSAAKLSLQVL